MAKLAMEIGEGFAGDGADAAHINTVLGLRNGPVGTAFATALATPTPGHVPFLAVWAPNIPVQPSTLFVNKATIEGELHGTLTWGAAQAGVAAGVTEHVASRFAPHELDEHVLIIAVWVNPAATNAELVYANNRDATLIALQRGATATTSSTETSAISSFVAGLHPQNPYFST